MIHPLISDLKQARGKQFYGLLATILQSVGPLILTDADRVIAETGRFQLRELAKLVIKYDFPFKTMCEYLEEEKRLPTGTYMKLKDRGLKVGKILDQVRAEINS